MAPVTNGRVLFKSIPDDYPVPGKTTVYDTSQTIDPDKVALGGGVLVKTLELSIDPYMRGRMRPQEQKSYAPAFVIGEPLNGFGVGVVVRSEHSKVKAGDHVYGMLDHSNYFVRKDLVSTGLGLIKRDDHKLPWSTYVGVLGMPGKTAYMAWKEYSKAKSGETAFVSTGAGPVGSLVIQLAKLDGLKVIGSAGSDEKVKFMKDIGADVAFNYKTTNTKEVLAKEGPIDVFWDNVGGETLEAALDDANIGARFIECGMIAGYNNPSKAAVRNLFHVIAKSISMYGFIVGRLEEKYNEQFQKTLPPLVASGKIKFKEDIANGLESVGDVTLAVQKGTNKAKAVVHVAEE